MIWVIIIFNFLITSWDSFAAGVLWEQSETPFEKFIAAAAFIIGFVGFLYTFILVGVALEILGTEFLLGTNVILGLPIIVFGIVVTINGWATAIRERSIVGGLVSIYNTTAIIWDIRVWYKSLEQLFKIGGIKTMVSGLKGRKKNKATGILFIVLGIIITILFAVGLFMTGREAVKRAYY